MIGQSQGRARRRAAHCSVNHRRAVISPREKIESWSHFLILNAAAFQSGQLGIFIQEDYNAVMTPLGDTASYDIQYATTEV